MNTHVEPADTWGGSPFPTLAVESSGPLGSVALDLGSGRVLQRHLADRRRHASGLLPAVHRLLAEAGLHPSDLAQILVGAGPGSFTGIRVAASAALGLAGALGVPLHSASSLAAGAFTESLPDMDGALLVCFDARGERLFIAGFEWQAGTVSVVLPPRFAHLDQVVSQEFGLAPGAPCAGAGAHRHRRALEEAGLVVHPPPAGLPTAAGLLAVARHAPELVTPWYPGGEPEYLRATSAERSG